jgi:D-arginine dehydrogenase
LNDSDFIVIGGGMAGASAAYFLAAESSVTVLEMENQPGYHTTGRSAALYTEAYGNATIRALTTGGRPFFMAAPTSWTPLTAPRKKPANWSTASAASMGRRRGTSFPP